MKIWAKTQINAKKIKIKKKILKKKSTPKPDNSETNYTMQKTVIKIISLHNLLHKGPINIMAEQLHHANQPVASQNFLPA